MTSTVISSLPRFGKRPVCAPKSEPSRAEGFLSPVKTYSEKLRDPRWQRKRLAVMERDNFTCRDCSATDQPLHVHHCYYAKGGPWDTEDQLLLTLCADCHERRAEPEAVARNALGVIFARYTGAGVDRFAKQLLSIAELPKAKDGMGYIVQLTVELRPDAK
jgi:hypothetical protein